MTNIIDINAILEARALEELGVSTEEEFDAIEWALDAGDLLQAEEELDFNED